MFYEVIFFNTIDCRATFRTICKNSLLAKVGQVIPFEKFELQVFESGKVIFTNVICLNSNRGKKCKPAS